MSHQDEDDFNILDDDSIIDWLIFERNDATVRVNTMEIIKNLPIINADIPNNSLSGLPIRDNPDVSSLTGSSGKIFGRRKGGINKSTIDKIKNWLNDYGSHSQQMLTTKAVK